MLKDFPLDTQQFSQPKTTISVFEVYARDTAVQNTTNNIMLTPIFRHPYARFCVAACVDVLTEIDAENNEGGNAVQIASVRNDDGEEPHFLPHVAFLALVIIILKLTTFETLQASCQEPGICRHLYHRGLSSTISSMLVATDRRKREFGDLFIILFHMAKNVEKDDVEAFRESVAKMKPLFPICEQLTAESLFQTHFPSLDTINSMFMFLQ